MSPRLRTALVMLNAWRRQPTTIGGLAALVAAGGAWSEGNHATALWVGAGGLVGCLMPEDMRTRGPMTQLLVDVVSAGALHQVVTSLPKLAADAVAVAAADTPAANPQPAPENAS